MSPLALRCLRWRLWRFGCWSIESRRSFVRVAQYPDSSPLSCWISFTCGSISLSGLVSLAALLAMPVSSRNINTVTCIRRLCVSSICTDTNVVRRSACLVGKLVQKEYVDWTAVCFSQSRYATTAGVIDRRRQTNWHRLSLQTSHYHWTWTATKKVIKYCSIEKCSKMSNSFGVTTEPLNTQRMWVLQQSNYFSKLTLHNGNPLIDNEHNMIVRPKGS